MVFVNPSNSLGVVLAYMTNNLTGSLFLTVMAIVFLLMLIGFAFNLPLELQTTYILPLLIGLMAFSSEYVVVGGVAVLYLSVVFAKMFILNF